MSASSSLTASSHGSLMFPRGRDRSDSAANGPPQKLISLVRTAPSMRSSDTTRTGTDTMSTRRLNLHYPDSPIPQFIRAYPAAQVRNLPNSCSQGESPTLTQMVLVLALRMREQLPTQSRPYFIAHHSYGNMERPIATLANYAVLGSLPSIVVGVDYGL